MTSTKNTQSVARSLLNARCENYLKKTKKKMIPVKDGMPPRQL